MLFLVNPVAAVLSGVILAELIHLREPAMLASTASQPHMLMGRTSMSLRLLAALCKGQVKLCISQAQLSFWPAGTG